MDEAQVQVCRNGHVIVLNLAMSPEQARDHCRDCGESTLAECPNCRAPIPSGDCYQEREPDAFGRPVTHTTPPKYCTTCGHPFPWTERRLLAVAQAIEDSELSAEERETAQDAAKEIIDRTPTAEGAAQRLKHILGKAGAGAGQAVRDILVDVASEAVKKQLGW